MRILHLSDLHFKAANQWNLNPVLQAAIEDIAILASTRAFDAVIFTGDLVYSGSDSRIFHDAVHDCLLPIILAAGVDLDALAVVPGNHDIHPRHVSLPMEAGLPKQLNTTAAVNAFIDDPASLSFRNSRWANFNVFATDTWEACQRVDDQALGRTVRLSTPSGSIAISLANSAWRATAQSDDYDRHRIIYSERQLQQLRQTLDHTADLRIFAGHHPPDWLPDFDRDSLWRELALQYDIGLFGHTHQPRPSTFLDEHGSVFVNTTGALFQESGRRGAITVLDVDLDAKSITCRYRCFDEHRQVMVPDEGMAPGGTKTLPLKIAPPSNLPVAASMPLSAIDIVSATRQQLSEVLTLVQTPHAPDACTLDLLIEPAAYPLREQTSVLITDDGQRVERVPLHDWVVAGDVIFLLGGKEYGKTSSLLWLLDTALEKSSNQPVYVDLARVPHTDAAIKRHIRTRLLAIGIRTREDLSDAPSLALAFDNLSASDHRSIEIIQTLAKQFASSLFFISVEDDGFTALPDRWWSGRPFGTAFLGQYGAREVRALVEVLYPDAGDTRAREMFTSALQILVNQSLTRSPWVVVMVLLVFNYEPSFQNTDITNLVDRYLDLVLGKWSSLTDSRSNAFDFSNRKHFLSLLAKKMDDESVSSVSLSELETFAEAYVRDYGAPVAGREIVDDLIRRHVLGGSPSEIRFALGDVNQFLLAVAVERGELPIEHFLRDYLRYFDAIVHHAAFGRNPRDLLQFFEQEVGRILGDMEFPAGLMFDSVDEQAWGSMPGRSQMLKSLERLGEESARVQSNAVQEEFGDQMLSEAQGQSAHESREHDDSQSSDAERGFERLLGAVALLSLCLQRSDHLGDQPYRVQLVGFVLTGWARCFAAACAVHGVGDPGEKDRMLDELVRAGLSRKRIAAVLEMRTFANFMGWVDGLLRCPKLAPTLAQVYEQVPDARSDMVTAILLWLAMFGELAEGWKELLVELEEKYGDRPHVVFILQMLLGSTYYDRSTSENDASRIQEALADLLVFHLRGTEQRVARADEMRRLGSLRQRSLMMQRQELTRGEEEIL